MLNWKFWSAMLAIAGLTALLAFGFTKNPRIVPSPLVGKPAPAFEITELNSGERLTSQELKGTPYLLNFWASWCEACKTEAPYLKLAYEQYERRTGGRFRVIGIAIQDTPEKARAFARRYGKKYFLALDNDRGDISLEWGLYGVPETFFVDGEGIIRFKQIGALTPDVIDREFPKLMEPLFPEPSLPGGGPGDNRTRIRP